MKYLLLILTIKLALSLTELKVHEPKFEKMFPNEEKLFKVVNLDKNTKYEVRISYPSIVRRNNILN